MMLCTGASIACLLRKSVSTSFLFGAYSYRAVGLEYFVINIIMKSKNAFNQVDDYLECLLEELANVYSKNTEEIFSYVFTHLPSL
ncbi:hypothetical protein RclHR1_01140022 [Rhizophagus clarus]|uniref:Uncharacterized protein n=1 Tax=Rhizophagus clarus TaxID=94130 RepID=A0A2Z6Q3Z1_9GLOM|nr:hypothetical protein RclHR1_01140022 [Rhizophagus clarus]